MPGRGSDQALADRDGRGARRAGVRPRANPAATKPGARELKRHHRELIERELREVREECMNVVRLLQRLDEYRAARRDAGGILADLSVAVSHLHVHTKDLDDEIFDLPDRTGPLPPLD
jgi:hypothetical protein